MLRGILNLRIAEDDYMSVKDDLAIAIQLDKAFDRLDFEGLLAYFFELQPEISHASRRRQIEHIATAPGRVARWFDRLGASANRGPILDLGCGSGSFTALAAKAS